MRNIDSPLPATPTIQVIERMMTLMDVLASQEEAISLKEISAKTGLHPSTAHRILNDLVLGRFVDHPQAGSYRLGMRLLELGNLVKNRLNVRDAALEPMRELHRLIQQPVNLSIRQGDEIIYVERAYSERSGMQVIRAIGGRAPLHLTSVGKLFLAADDPKKFEPMPCAPGSAVTPATASRNCQRLSANSPRCAGIAMPATTKNWNWGCAAWRQAFWTTRGNWWRACQFPHQRVDWKSPGYPN